MLRSTLLSSLSEQRREQYPVLATMHVPNKEPVVEEQMNDAPLDLKGDNVFDDAAADTIPPKYRGTLADQKDMSTLGKKQVLRRNFKFVTMVGFASTVIVSWEILLP